MGKNYLSRYWKTISPEHQGRVYQVGKGCISRFYKTMSPEDQRAYNRWLKGNAILGFILAGGLVLLHHKILCRECLAICAEQQGHRGRVLTKAAIRRRRMVAIEWGM